MGNIVKCQLYFKSFKKDILYLKTQTLLDTCRSLLNITKVTLISLPTKIKKITVNASPHIDKKAREQFEMRTHSYSVEISCKNSDAINKVLEELKNKSLVGLNIKVVLTYSSSIVI